MNKNIIPYILSLALATGLAAKPVRNGAVEAELVSAVTSIQPGKPFTVALRMRHDPHWHSYWLNPGTGLATSLEWKLPEGFKAAAIEWPVPGILRDAAGKITGYGYEGENFLLVHITPPAALAAGTDVTLQAHAEWLMCREVCMPGAADLMLTLPVRGETPAPDEKWAKKVAEFDGRKPADLPPGWNAEASRKGAAVELHLQVGDGARPLANSLYFFSADGLIDYEQPQVVKLVRDGYILRLAVAETADPTTTRLLGVIRSDNGWGSAGEGPDSGTNLGLRVDIPLRR